jgi:hypothetical protein
VIQADATGKGERYRTAHKAFIIGALAAFIRPSGRVGFESLSAAGTA